MHGDPGGPLVPTQIGVNKNNDMKIKHATEESWTMTRLNENVHHATAKATLAMATQNIINEQTK